MLKMSEIKFNINKIQQLLPITGRLSQYKNRKYNLENTPVTPFFNLARSSKFCNNEFICSDYLHVILTKDNN